MILLCVCVLFPALLLSGLKANSIPYSPHRSDLYLYKCNVNLIYSGHTLTVGIQALSLIASLQACH